MNPNVLLNAFEFKQSVFVAYFLLLSAKFGFLSFLLLIKDVYKLVDPGEPIIGFNKNVSI